jgi:cytochrome c oxidase cbb3-type subunit 2
MFHWLEKKPFYFALGVFIAVSIAGLVTVLPNFVESSRPIKGVKPYTVLQIAGRQVYIKESCNSCHSQLIRPFKHEVDRYGDYSLSGEYVYDRPFLWGSKRTGPDLLRVGLVRTTDWHEAHFKNSASIVPGSIMPNYIHLFNKVSDFDTAYAEAYTVKVVFNVPYDAEGMPVLGTLKDSKALALEEAKEVAKLIKDKNIHNMLDKGEIPEVVALISYLNSLK